jgi:hypothetical protein
MSALMWVEVRICACGVGWGRARAFSQTVENGKGRQQACGAALSPCVYTHQTTLTHVYSRMLMTMLLSILHESMSFYLKDTHASLKSRF